MADLHFEWEPAKARANARKHGISFEEAETAFSDEHALVLPDPDHSSRDEERLVLRFAVVAGHRVAGIEHGEVEDHGALVVRLEPRVTGRQPVLQ